MFTSLCEATTHTPVSDNQGAPYLGMVQGRAIRPETDQFAVWLNHTTLYGEGTCSCVAGSDWNALANLTTCYYVVDAVNAGGTSGYSTQVSTTPAAPVSVPIDSSYKLVFDDEFNQPSVDTGKWTILTNDSIGGGYTKNQFLPTNAVEGGGFLSLLCSLQSRADRPYRGGFIVGKQAWSYGYWEVRAKMPVHGCGTWPAFWMNNGGTYPEIDIFEWLGNNPTGQALSYHPPDDATLTGGAGFSRTITGPDYSNSFHVYGMWWQPTAITWYVDGVQVFQLTQGQQYNGKAVSITGTPMETIFTAAVGGFNNNVPDLTTVYPADFAVDYIHIYSNSLNAVAVAPQAGYGGLGDSVGSGDNPPLYQSPSFTSSPLGASVPINLAYNFTFATSGNPLPSLALTSGTLPGGLSLSSTGILSGTPVAAGTYSGIVTADDGINLPVNQNFSLTILYTYSSWAATKFGNRGAPAMTDPMATPQNDSIPNLLKYLIDIDPSRAMSSSDSASLPSAKTKVVSGTPCLTLTYRQNPLDGGITVDLQTSLDLKTWGTVTPDFILSAGTDPQTGDPLVEDCIRIGNSNRTFLRLKVTAP